MKHRLSDHDMQVLILDRTQVPFQKFIQKIKLDK